MTSGRLVAVPEAARPYQGQPAGLVSRSVANVIDAVVVAALLIGGYLLFTGLRFLLRPRTFQFSEPSGVLSVSAALVLCVVYFTASWATTGRTYGDYVMGLRVVTRRGGRLHLLRALARAALCVAFPVGLLLAGTIPRRSLADIAVRTSVIYDWLHLEDEVSVPPPRT